MSFPIAPRDVFVCVVYLELFQSRCFLNAAESNVTFTVRVSSFLTPWEYGEASITLNVGSPILKAIIKGRYYISVPEPVLEAITFNGRYSILKLY